MPANNGDLERRLWDAAVYTDEQYLQKCELAYHHVYESYFGAGKSIYAAA